MKEIYVINLNKKRISLLLGVFLVMLGSTLWLGLKIGRTDLRETAHSNELLALSESEKQNARERGDDRLSLFDSSLESIVPNSASGKQNEDLILKSGKVPPLHESAIAPKDMEAIPVKNYDPLRRAQKKKTARRPTKSQAGHFSIQVAAFSREKDASSLVKRMKAEGFHDVRVDRGIRYYYVRSGRSRNKNMLSGKNERIKKLLNVKTLIVKGKAKHS